VGHERLEEQADPEKAIDRSLKAYLAKGYSKDWINQRLKTIGKTIISQKNAQALIAEKQAQQLQKTIAQHTDEIIDSDI
jgi:hypothetical protein